MRGQGPADGLKLFRVEKFGQGYLGVLLEVGLNFNLCRRVQVLRVDPLEKVRLVYSNFVVMWTTFYFTLLLYML